MMKKLFTLIAMAAMAMSVNAQTTLTWEKTMDKAQSVTTSSGYKLTILKNGKTYSAGSVITIDGTEYTTFKLSNGAQNTLEAPEGKAFDKVTFYSYMNMKADAQKVRASYWKEFNNTSVSMEEQGGAMKSCNQTFDPTVEGAAELVGLDNPDKREFSLDSPATKITFTNTGEQLGFIVVLHEVSSTGIAENISTPVKLNTPIYNLAGQQVSKTFKGVVIKNGKKYVQ